MSEEILRLKAPLYMKLFIPLSFSIAIIISIIQGDFSGDVTTLVIFIGILLILSVVYFWRMNRYYAALYTDKIVVQNFFRKNEYTFEGLTGVSDVITTSVSGGNPIWIRSFTLNYTNNKPRKVKIAGLSYKPGKQFLDTFISYLQQASQME